MLYSHGAALSLICGSLCLMMFSRSAIVVNHWRRLSAMMLFRRATEIFSQTYRCCAPGVTLDP
jgi:hypothetical protein